MSRIDDLCAPSLRAGTPRLVVCAIIPFPLAFAAISVRVTPPCAARAGAVTDAALCAIEQQPRPEEPP